MSMNCSAVMPAVSFMPAGYGWRVYVLNAPELLETIDHSALMPWGHPISVNGTFARLGGLTQMAYAVYRRVYR